MSTVVYVGMDVDKEKIVIAKLLAGSQSTPQECVIANRPTAVRKFFAALQLQNNTPVCATYEAGCFGFVLYRQLEPIRKPWLPGRL